MLARHPILSVSRGFRDMAASLEYINSSQGALSFYAEKREVEATETLQKQSYVY